MLSMKTLTNEPQTPNPDMTTVHISIIVHRGAPLDYPHYRHTALWSHFGDQYQPLIAHVVGPVGDFEFESREEAQPWKNEDFAKIVDVGPLATTITQPRLEALLRAIPIRNHDREFNCQTWVEAALKRLAESGLLAQQAYESGLDGMVEAIAEAEDVEE